MKNFWQRTITGALFIIVVISSILLGAGTFAFLFGGVIVLAMLEMKKMLTTSEQHPCLGLSLLLGVALWLASLANLLMTNLPFNAFLIVVPLAVAVVIAEMYRKHQNPFLNIAVTFLIPVYVVVPFIFLQRLAFISGEYNGWLVLSFFVLIWINDTGAYLVGVTMGKRRLFPRHSPKKSWEGFIGGVVLSLVVSYGVSLFITDFNMWLWLGAALIVSVLGTMGDLAESMLKRSMDVKDSGSLLPGHGGIMDRFDALTFAAPMVYVLFEIFK